MIQFLSNRLDGSGLSVCFFYFVIAKMNPQFQHIGRCGALNYYYTAPAKVPVNPTESPESRFVMIKSALDGVRGRGAWVWIFDCGGMEMRHSMGPETVRRLANLIATEHAEELQRIVFVRPNFWMQSVLTLMRSLFNGPLATKILVLEGSSRLETMLSMEGVGLSGAVLGWVMGCFFSHE